MLCKVCGKEKPRKEFGKVGTVVCCGPCMPSVIEVQAEAMANFRKGFEKFMAEKDSAARKD